MIHWHSLNRAPPRTAGSRRAPALTARPAPLGVLARTLPKAAQRLLLPGDDGRRRDRPPASSTESNGRRATPRSRRVERRPRRSPSANGEAVDHGQGRRSNRHEPRSSCPGVDAAVRVELPQPCRAGPGQDGLQRRRLPRGARRQGRLPALAPRLRPGSRFFNIVKQDRGRRVDLGDPGRSLFLAKPSGAIPHKGGLRFATAIPRIPHPRRLDRRRRARPSRRRPRLSSVSKSRPTVRSSKSARLSRSSSAPTTPTAGPRTSPAGSKWSSADESVCRVDDHGKAQVIGPGEGAIVAWYASKLAIARITVPYDEPIAPGTDTGAVVDQRKPRNFIDEQIDRQLAGSTCPPRRPADDAEFLRRA